MLGYAFAIILHRPAPAFGPPDLCLFRQLEADFRGFLHSGVELSLHPIPGRYYRERPTRMNTVNVGKLPRRYIRINYHIKDQQKHHLVFCIEFINLFELQNIETVDIDLH